MNLVVFQTRLYTTTFDFLKCQGSIIQNSVSKFEKWYLNLVLLNFQMAVELDLEKLIYNSSLCCQT